MNMNENNNLLGDTKDERNDDRVTWDSFCFKMNKGFCKFFVQVGISCGVLCLSAYKIIVLDEAVDKSLYVSLLTLILGIYLPQPSIK